ncbi:MAG TPA: sn-glycerol-3-phosphate ABC transporter ATP-binding protein UgpC [Sedimentisphaerales bacterium]|nr:sn-glycerol-3-phosphate ABC transporter ATP-binding protein UgpC [Sedimentisphaerales bacterium]
MALLRLENVTKIFEGNVPALTDFSLDVADGEFMVVVGPSGCGKTTMLRLIAGLECPTMGNIYIGDTPVNDIAPRDRDVAMVFQNYALYPHMTVAQNMAFALKMRKSPKSQIHKKVGEVAALLGIEDLLDRKPNTLSGGQRQRVALARTIVRSPAAFLFDEPLSNLDARLRALMRAELKRLHRRLHTTTVYVTHDQAEAMTLGDRIAVMYNGAIQQAGAPMQVYERPANRFVAGFLGGLPMNFFPGRVRLSDDAAHFVLGADDAVTLSRHCRMLLSGYDGQEMLLGIRPENLSLRRASATSAPLDNLISAVVDVIEPLGAGTEVYLTSGSGTKFVAYLTPHVKLDIAESVQVSLDPEKVHVFEPGQTGRNVTLA